MSIIIRDDTIYFEAIYLLLLDSHTVKTLVIAVYSSTLDGYLAYSLKHLMPYMARAHNNYMKAGSGSSYSGWSLNLHDSIVREHVTRLVPGVQKALFRPLQGVVTIRLEEIHRIHDYRQTLKQSPCTALTGGIHLLLGLCEGIIRDFEKRWESSSVTWAHNASHMGSPLCYIWISQSRASTAS